MFLFIPLLPYRYFNFDNSNTSYVLVYHFSESTYTTISYIQIHLMFLFILDLGTKVIMPNRFKYILCSCLSISQKKRYICFIDSNTSYILVYREIPEGALFMVQFKYILCSCLSGTARRSTALWTIQIHLMFLFILKLLLHCYIFVVFKYILCSCLSYICIFTLVIITEFKYILCSCLS